MFLRPPEQRHNALEHIAPNNVYTIIDQSVFIAADVKDARPGDWISVNWSGVAYPRYDDYVAMYNAASDTTRSAPIKYKLALTSPSHLLGAGSARFATLVF